MNHEYQSTHMLPPISMLTSPRPIPVSPPIYDNRIELPLPNRSTKPYSPNYTTDSSSLWELFNQFQQHQQQSKPSKRRSSDSTQGTAVSSEEVLAEKRRRNAGASARFRDRRKQREKELQDKCDKIESRAKQLEDALRLIQVDHPLLKQETSSAQSSSPAPFSDTLVDRVGQLEHLMVRFREEKETDAQKLEDLEQENKYLRSLLIGSSEERNTR